MSKSEMEENTTQPTPTAEPSIVTPAPPVPAPTKPPRSKLVYVLIGLLVLLILTVGASAAVYISKSLKPKPTPTPTPIRIPSPSPISNSKIYTGKGFSFQIPDRYAISSSSENEARFVNTNGFGLTALKWQNVPFPEPVAKPNSTKNDGTTVERTAISLDGKQLYKYTVTNTQTELNIIEIVYFRADGTYYELSTHINAGGISINKFLSTFKFTGSNVTPTPDSTANWKTYTNPTFTYSLRYPPNWEAFRQNADDTSISIRPIGTKEIPVVIESQPNTNNLSSEEFLNTQVGKTYDRKIITINNVNWYVIENTSSPYKSRSYITTNNKNSYDLSVSTLNQIYVDTFNQILSTFKFTN